MGRSCYRDNFSAFALLVVQKHWQKHHADGKDKAGTSAGDNRPLSLGQTPTLQRWDFVVHFFCPDIFELVHRIDDLDEFAHAVGEIAEGRDEFDRTLRR